MAGNALDTCLNGNLRNSSDNCLRKGQSKKKFCGYHYVPSESDEADTLKDKFWRDLEEGKFNFLNTVDMYTRVKRLSKLSEVNFLTVANDSHVLPSGPVTCLPSCVSSSSLIVSPNIPASDASPPSSSSGYESSSIPSIGSASATDSPTDSEQHAARLCDFFATAAQTHRSVAKRKRKCIWEPLARRSKFCKHHPVPRNVSRQRKMANSKFFRYVDASSEEADTLKDKFWRNLEMGNVSANTSTDLYSSVKVSRRTRQLSFSMRNFDYPHEGDFVEDAVVSCLQSPGNSTSECTEMSSVSIGCCESEDSSYKRKPVSGTLDQMNDGYMSEQLTSIADCKLLSPCSVTVERLRHCLDDADTFVAGSAEMHNSIVADNLNCRSRSADTMSNSVRDDLRIVSSDTSVNGDRKRCWRSGRLKNGLQQLSKAEDAITYICGTNTRVERIHLFTREINGSLSQCHVPSPFPCAWQRHIICGWLDDDSIFRTGDILSLSPLMFFDSSILELFCL